jgi:hypothetical protein
MATFFGADRVLDKYHLENGNIGVVVENQINQK